MDWYDHGFLILGGLVAVALFGLGVICGRVWQEAREDDAARDVVDLTPAGPQADMPHRYSTYRNL